MTTNTVRCPLDPCPTDLQRTAGGTLRDGVVAHLTMIHGLNGVVAYDTTDRALGGFTRELSGDWVTP